MFVALVPTVIFGLVLFSFKRASNKVEQAIREQTADIPAGNYLFLRCSGDEAAAALSAAQFIAWLSIWVSRRLELLTRPILDRGRPMVLAVYWSVLSLCVLAIADGWLDVLPGIWKSGFGFLLSPGELLQTAAKLVLEPIFEADFEDSAYGYRPPFAKLDVLHNFDHFVYMILYMGHIVWAFVSFVVVCVLFLCLFAVFLIFLAQAVTSWAFGWTRFSTGFLVELAIEPLPFGEHRLMHIDWTAGSNGPDGFVHSWTYAHQVAIKHLQNWVRASLGKLPMNVAEPTTVRP
jgi:hypothetical protein